MLLQSPVLKTIVYLTVLSGAASITTAQQASSRRVLNQGTFFSCTSLQRVNDQLQGHFDCMVSRNVYDRNGTNVLIPQGSKVLGTVQKVASGRLFVAFHSIVLAGDKETTIPLQDGQADATDS